MKRSKAEILHRSHRLPALRFEDQQLTSFSGLIVFQRLFAVLGLRERLRLLFSRWYLLTPSRDCQRSIAVRSSPTLKR